jgi:hypothetical protein
MVLTQQSYKGPKRCRRDYVTALLVYCLEWKSIAVIAYRTKFYLLLPLNSRSIHVYIHGMEVRRLSRSKDCNERSRGS